MGHEGVSGQGPSGGVIKTGPRGGVWIVAEGHTPRWGWECVDTGREGVSRHGPLRGGRTQAKKGCLDMGQEGRGQEGRCG